MFQCGKGNDESVTLPTLGPTFRWFFVVRTSNLKLVSADGTSPSLPRQKWPLFPPHPPTKKGQARGVFQLLRVQLRTEKKDGAKEPGWCLCPWLQHSVYRSTSWICREKLPGTPSSSASNAPFLKNHSPIRQKNMGVVWEWRSMEFPSNFLFHPFRWGRRVKGLEISIDQGFVFLRKR